MLRKLGSYPRQNGLAVVRELGRIERTLFILTGCKVLTAPPRACRPEQR